jgi:ABC-type transport system substrate-binding protein
MTEYDSKRSRVNRRSFVKGAAAMGAMTGAGAFGLPFHAWAQGVPMQYDGSKFQLRAAEPNAKSGGVLKYGITSRPPHFDFHQSGTINSLGSQGCMFDNLIRRDPRDSGTTIIPDLAHSWDIAKDGKTYTFKLRKDVLFHDGAEMTSDDVKATFDRIAKPPQGISIPRSTLFAAVSEITTPDKYTVQFKLPGRARLLMGALASGWNGIVRRRPWRTTTTTCAASSTSPAPARSAACGASRPRSG